MTISEAERAIRTHFVGGFYGQLVSGLLWLTSAGLAVWRGPRASILMLVVGGFFIFPATELLIRAIGKHQIQGTTQMTTIAIIGPPDETSSSAP